MATGKLAVFWTVVGVVAVGVFALPLLAGDDAKAPAKPSTTATDAKTPATTREAAITKLAAILTSSKTTLSQAIATAEKAAKGRAFAAELECNAAGKAYYDVEILTNGEKPRIVDVLVDVQSGAVARMDDDDDDDEDDDGDDDDDKSGKSDGSGKSGMSGKSDESGKSGMSGKSGKSDGSSAR